MLKLYRYRGMGVMPNPPLGLSFRCSSSICVAMVEGGPKRAAMLATGRMPDGAPIVGLGGNWKCVQESCGNINFPSRTVCNKCKAPKPTQADLAAKGIAVAGVLTPRVGGVGGVSPHLASAVANPAGGYYPPVPPLGGVPPNVMLPAAISCSPVPTSAMVRWITSLPNGTARRPARSHARGACSRAGGALRACEVMLTHIPR